MSNAAPPDSEYFSLYDELTETQSGGVPAADLIRYLVKEIGHDVCEAKRNTQASYRLVSAARDAYNEINKRMNGSTKSTDDWDNYLKQVELIEPLEELLFEFASVAEIESTLTDTNVRSVESIDSFETWENNRQKVREALGSSALNPGANPELNKDLAVLTKYDDLSWLSTVCDSASTSTTPLSFNERDYKGSVNPAWLGLGDVISTISVLNQVYSALQAMPTIDDSTIVLSTRCAMVLDGVLKFAGTRTGEHKVIGLYLMCKKLWDEAKGILTKLLKHIEAGQHGAEALSRIKDEWTLFEERLKETPESYNPQIPGLDTLIGYVENVRRPFHARALALVQQCHAVWSMVKKGDSLEPLNDTIQAAIQALQSAETAKSEFSVLKWTDVESHQGTQDFAHAVDRICSSTESYGRAGGAAGVRQAMAIAEQKDKKLVELLEQRVSRQRRRQRGAKVAVKVTTWDGTITGRLFEMDPAETVDLILWKIFAGNTGGLGLIPRFYIKGPEGRDDYQPVRSGTKLETFSASSITLFLALRPEEQPQTPTPTR